MMDTTRRSFIAGSLIAAPVAGMNPARETQGSAPREALRADDLGRLMQDEKADKWWPRRVDLSPARWIWLPSKRVPACTFVLFRRELTLDARPVRATAWIAADSRYRLTVNGKRVQWGPAPCDPRHLDVDPADITQLLVPGPNVIGAEVLFYGYPEGTWPGGKPGLLFLGRLEMPDGRVETLVSDQRWLSVVDRAHPPGRAKRWFLRALQEEYDARRHPEGWDTAAVSPGPDWLPAEEIDCPPDKPIACARGTAWANDSVDRVTPAVSDLRLRQIPPMREETVPVHRLQESGSVEWLRDPSDWFEFRMPRSFRIERNPAVPAANPPWTLPAPPSGHGAYAIFEFAEQVVGWPYFTIDAPEGTIVELMPQESHDPAKTSWLDTHYFAWSRFTCREGRNRFECFDYESLRWLQLHVRNASRPVVIEEAGVRRREFAWARKPHVRTSDPLLARLFDASLNTLRNSAQETAMDGAGRERQQYSGDGGHQLVAVRYAFGETRLGRRYLRTFSEGLAKDGYFMDSWPAADRLARIAQKQMDGAFWGPLLDHGIGFNFDCWNHYMDTGEREALVEPYPRLARFADYLWSLRAADGLLPVENLGIPTVWMDHNAYREQRHKQCAFNLYAAAMYEHALAPIAELMGEAAVARACRRRGGELLAAATRRFWSPERGIFVNNLPWSAAEKGIRLCDRSLATAILFDQCPDGNTRASVRALAELPPELGFSYPANAGWRLSALAKAGRADVAVREFRSRWAGMASVVQNNALQEDWVAGTDSTAEWSHCPLAPLNVTFQDLAGIRPLAPGFRKCRIRPQLADLPDLELTAWTPLGPIAFSAAAHPGGHACRVALPSGCEGELVLTPGSQVFGRGAEPIGAGAHRISEGGAVEFHLAGL